MSLSRVELLNVPDFFFLGVYLNQSKNCYLKNFES